MKGILFHPTMAMVVACVGAPLHAQQPYIESLSRNGELVATNLSPGSWATIEWAPTVTGPWSDQWMGLRDVAADSNGIIQVQVPMFYRVRLSNPDPARLVWISPGTFMMGSPASEAETSPGEQLHQVTITRGFWMGKHEVTQAEYVEVVGSNPSFFSGTNLPVEKVTWSDATNYCSLFTEREHLAGRLVEGYVYRLPTEAEWEYACRAGTLTSHHYGNELLSGMANFNGGFEYDASIGTIVNPSGLYLERTVDVGSYSPNAWGLNDMHGNVAEWCQDWFEPYSHEPVTDPTGPETGTVRVRRGGSYYSRGRYCRSADRLGNFPDFNPVGFRVVLAAALP